MRNRGFERADLDIRGLQDGLDKVQGTKIDVPRGHHHGVQASVTELRLPDSYRVLMRASAKRSDSKPGAHAERLDDLSNRSFSDTGVIRPTPFFIWRTI